jgi:hypothetical protein
LSVPQEQQQDLKTKQINQIRAEYYLQKERKLKCSFHILNLFAKETDCYKKQHFCYKEESIAYCVFIGTEVKDYIDDNSCCVLIQTCKTKNPPLNLYRPLQL